MSNPLSWTHDAARLDSGARVFDLQAREDERRAVASALDLLNVEVLNASYTLKATAGGRISMTGKLRANGTQRCVITQDPVAFSVNEPIDVEFSEEAAPETSVGDELEISSLADVEPIEDGAINAGRVIFELLAVSLDPYPRAPGVSFDAGEHAATQETGTDKPFAVLAKLKRNQ